MKGKRFWGRSLAILTLWLSIWNGLTVDEAWTAAKAASKKEGSRNSVIVLMVDGAGSAHTTIARWYKGEPLALDKMLLSGFRTYSTDSLITDSAPAATAFATGHKTNDKYIGIYPSRVSIPGIPPVKEKWKSKPLATVLEAAKMAGKSVGLITTTNVQHASPAAFSAHVPDRDDYNEIAEQQVYLGMDVVFGGGKRYLLPLERKGKRTDGEDLVAVLKKRGYAFIETREELLGLPPATQKVWGLFADGAMAYAFDRETLRSGEPSLAEMTRKALEILSRNPKGFFLFVEAGKVDWASHANDPIGVIGDLLAFDEAVKISLEFARKRPGTLVLAFADHGNGGMTLGSPKTNMTYAALPLEALLEPLKKAKLTGEGVEAVLGPYPTEEKIKEVMKTYYGLGDLTSQEIESIQKAGKGFLNYVIGPMISSRSVIGWTTRGHSGEDLFLYYFGLNRPLPMMENTDIAGMISRHLGVDLSRTDQALFVPADQAFSRLGAQIDIDASDPKNKVLVIKQGGKTARLPFSKNILQINDKDYEMQGITIYAPSADNGQGRVYVPLEAVEMFKKK